jgi:hypothetical protein
MDGTWNLEVATPFGKHTATLFIERAGGAFSGNIESRLGSLSLTDISETPDGFAARAAYPFQGKTYSADIAGRVEGDQINGTIKVAHPIAPTVRFTGTRAV